MTFSTIASLGVSLQGGGGSGGGGGTPGGSDTQVQFNDGGSFGGDSGLTFNKTTDVFTLAGSLVINGGTLNGTLLNMSQTWGGTGTYTGIKYDVTDSGPSNAASLLMDLQVGGDSKLKVSKTGALLGPNAAFEIRPFSTNSFEVWLGGSRNFQLNASSQQLKLARDFTVAWSSNPTDVNVPTDTFLGRRGTANLRFGAADAAAPVAQTLSVQSVVAGTSNIAGANLTITGSQGTGTGAGGSIIFQVAPAGSSGTAQNALATALTIASDRTATFTGPIFLSGSTRKIFVSDSNSLSFGGNTFTFFLIDAASGNSIFHSDYPVAFGSSGVNTPDTFIRRDAANTLAQRNGANAQAFRVYNTYTSDTVYERGFIRWTGNELRIGTEHLGASARLIGIYQGGTRYQIIGGNFNQFDQPVYMSGANMVTDTSTGFKIGTGTTQKIGFWNATPVVQPTAVADATDAATVITQLNALLAHMRTIGLIAT